MTNALQAIGADAFPYKVTHKSHPADNRETKNPLQDKNRHKREITKPKSTLSARVKLIYSFFTFV